MSGTATCLHSVFVLGMNSQMETCDASIKFLKGLFGAPVDAVMGNITGSGNSTHNLLTLFINNFNIVLFSVVLIIFGYLTIIMVLNTANEGKFGGRDMASWSFALRVILPPALMVPIKGGFCLLQMAMLWLIIVGINMASYVWQHAVDDIKIGFTPTVPTAIDNAISQDIAEDFVNISVAKIAQTHKFSSDTKGATLNIGDVSVWATPYAQATTSALNAACEKLDTPYNAICENEVQQMQRYGIGNMLTSIGGPDAGESNTSTYPSVFMAIGGDASSKTAGNGKINTGGTFTVSKNLLPTNTTTSKTLIEQALEQLSTTGTINLVTDGDASISADFINCYSGTDKAACSFDNAMNKIQAQLTAEKPTNTPSNQSLATETVVGTGQTCTAQCRNTVSHAPLPGIADEKTCTASGEQWTTQCYRPNGANQKWTPVPGQNIGNSWWYAPRSYLQLNQAMSQNITQLANSVNSLQIPTQNWVTYTPPNTQPSLNYEIYPFNRQYKLDSDSSKTAVTNTPASGAVSNATITYNNAGVSAPSSDNQVLSNMPWGQMTQCYASYLPAGETAESCFNAAMGGTYKPKSITIGSASANNAGYTSTATQYPSQLEGTLEQIPIQYQNAFKLLMIMNMESKPAAKANGTTPLTNQQFVNDVYNIVEVLKYNHVFPGTNDASTGVDSSTETTPVNSWINDVFNHLMGENLPGTGTTSNKGIFAEIYSLGNANLSNLQDVISNSFNTMAKAQQIGLDMIDVVLDGLQTSYANINQKLKQDEKTDKDMATKAGVGIGIGGAAASLLGGGSLATAAAIVTQTELQYKMATQMLEIGKQMAWMPIAIVVLTSMFTAGISFAIVLPLTPFFLFWAGQIAWIIGVIEAMIAAPLIACGFVIPGGHTHFGHTLPGLRMLMGVIFRPVLMVLGLLCGMVLTYVVISFSSQGFQLVSSQILSFAATNSSMADAMGVGAEVSTTQGIIACILLFSFCSFMMLAFTKCFSCIYVIPEKVMQWVGGMAEKAGPQELQQMTQGISQGASQASGAGGQGAEKGIGAQQSNTQSEAGTAIGAGTQGAGQIGSAFAGDVGKKSEGSGKDSDSGEVAS